MVKVSLSTSPTFLLNFHNIPIIIDLYTSIISIGSSNQLIQLFLQLCLLRSENLWVVSFTRFSNKVNPQSTCIDMKSWLLYTKESSFISLEHGIWFGRDSKGEFHITNGLFQTEVCYQSWWTLYGGTDYSQFVPQISS